MPNIVMHHHFGKVVYSGLSEEVKKAIDDVKLYDFATTGPDSFEKINFISHKSLKENKAFSEYMHTHKTKEFFMKMTEMSRVDYHLFSYLCGFVTHYYLDVYTNPFITYFSGVYDPSDETTLENRGINQKIKIAMDCFVIKDYYDTKPNAFRINSRLLRLKRLNKDFKETFDKLYSSVYGKNDGYKYVNSAIKWQKHYYGLMFDRFGIIDKFLSKKDDGISKTDLKYVSYYNKKINSNEFDIFNLKRNPWNNPVDKDFQYNDSFFDLFDKAKKMTVECINELYKYIFDGETFDFDYFFKDLSYYSGFPGVYNLEMKFFNNIFKKDLF